VIKDIYSRISDDKDIIDNILADKNRTLIDDIAERIISIYVFLADVSKKLEEIKGKVITATDAEDIMADMILINSEISQILIEKAQEDQKFSYSDAYSQSNIVIDYIQTILNSARTKEALQKFYPDIPIVESKSMKILSGFDRDRIDMHTEYLMLINILMCIQVSPFYSEKDKHIVQSLLDCFANTLTNCRIKRIYMEPNCSFSEYENRFRATTKLEIFFSLANDDRYQLRLDFPHVGAEYIHFNVYEPFHDSAFPIDTPTYDLLVSKYGNDINHLFFNNGVAPISA